jgi:hypothetical protein
VNWCIGMASKVLNRLMGRIEASIIYIPCSDEFPHGLRGAIIADNPSHRKTNPPTLHFSWNAKGISKSLPSDPQNSDASVEKRHCARHPQLAMTNRRS